MYWKLIIKNIIWKLFNYHNPGNKKDIIIFTTRRSGSTWITDIIYSQNGIKYLDQPLDLRLADRTQKKLLPDDEYSKFVYLDDKEKKEKIFRYFELIFKSKLKVRNPWNIFAADYNFITDRQVLKLCNGKALMDDFVEKFDVDIIYFIRHPIPQSLSIMKRDWGYSPIYAFLNNKKFVDKYLGVSRFDFAQQILSHGTLLEKHVLNWVLQNLIPLKSKFDKKWVTLNYEELVMHPKKIINVLAEKFDLEDKKAMYKKIATPSKTTKGKNNEAKISSSNKERIDYLIKRWRKKCSEKDIRNVDRILNKFEIECYSAKKFIPDSEYLLLD